MKMGSGVRYIDYIVGSVLACVTRATHFNSDRPHRIHNIGNNRPDSLMRFIPHIEGSDWVPNVALCRPSSRSAGGASDVCRMYRSYFSVSKSIPSNCEGCFLQL